MPRISTHAPLAGRDCLAATLYQWFRYFNPRAPCGARQGRGRRESAGRRFQPTRPLRGATSATRDYRCLARISTHAPLAGRDLQNRPLTSRRRFQPTRPLRGATNSACWLESKSKISTHAPLAGRDPTETVGVNGHKYLFQPTRPLRGATGFFSLETDRSKVFQPTRPLRGATALHRGAGRCKSDFNPRAPCGARRPSSPATAAVIRTFQPTRPLRGATGLSGDLR